MSLLNAMADACRIAFWTVVIRGPGGGPRHDSYGYAVFARWCAQARLKQFLKGE